MRKIKEIVEDVIVVVSHIATTKQSTFETQIAECSAALVMKRTSHRHVIGKAKLNRTDNSVVVKLDLFDFPGQTKPGAKFEHRFALEREYVFD